MGIFSCDYLKIDGTFFPTYVCKLTMEKVESETASNVCNTSKYTNCYNYKKKSSWWFLANAAYESLELPPDDLETFAAWKCEYLCSHKEGQDFIREYNKIAPEIVTAINNNPNCKHIYEDMYTEHLLPCIKLIRLGMDTAAFNLYKAFYEKYKAIYFSA